MASPTSNNPQAMTTEAMKQTVLTGPSILIFGQISVSSLSTFDQVQSSDSSVAEHRISKCLLLCKSFMFQTFKQWRWKLCISYLVRQKSLTNCWVDNWSNWLHFLNFHFSIIYWYLYPITSFDFSPRIFKFWCKISVYISINTLFKLSVRQWHLKPCLTIARNLLLSWWKLSRLSTTHQCL